LNTLAKLHIFKAKCAVATWYNAFCNHGNMSAIEAVLSFVDSQFKEREIQPPVFRNDTLAEGYEFKEADKDEIIKVIKSDCQSKGQQVIIKDQKRSERKDLRDPPYIRVILTCHNAGSCNSKHEKLAKEDGGRPNTSTKKVACGAKIVLGRTVNKDGTTTPWKVSALHWLHNHPVGEDATTLRASLSPDKEDASCAGKAKGGIGGCTAKGKSGVGGCTAKGKSGAGGCTATAEG
jgi:hypothetical protein